MPSDLPDRWVLLRLEVKDRALSLRYRDDRRRVRRPGEAVEPVAPIDPILAERVSTVLLPKNLSEMVSQQVDDLPSERVGPHAGRPVPLPVFLDFPPELADVRWEVVGPQIAPLWDVDPARIQIVRLARERWVKRPPVHLPLRIVGLGVGVEHALADFQQRGWLLDTAIQHNALNLQTMHEPILARSVLGWDIVVADRRHAEVVLDLSSVGSRKAPAPRLVVLLQQGPESTETRDPLPPPGVSLLAVESLDAGELFLTEFLYGLVHDYPLHEAAKAGWETAAATLSRPPRIYADPASNQDLRFSDALDAMVRQARQTELVDLPGDVSGFLARVGAEAPPLLIKSLRRAEDLGADVDAGLSSVRGLQADFRQEASGLVPMAHAAERLASIEDAARLLRTELASAAAEPTVRDVIRKHQQRKVDVALERLEHSPLIEPWITAGQALTVDGDTVLRAGARYGLTVRIGRRLAGSLVQGEPPPVDPLLPGGGEHQLEVAVFGLDFTVIGRNAKPLALPALGASPPISFVVRAPERTGTCRLRIGIYHRNHMVQSFLLHALSEREERRAEPGTVSVVLEFSRTERFSNLDELRPRALSLGLNQAPAGGTHSLMVKRDGQARSFSFQWQAIEPRLSEFRTILKSATYKDGDEPRFPSGADPGADARSTFERTIRDLAELGKELYDGLWQRGRALEATLRAVSRSSNETIQVVRYDLNNVLPWSVLYDYPLPVRIAGAEPPAVCLGWGEGVEPGDSPAKRCEHGPGHPGYCIWGFWGVRHLIEELPVVGDELGESDPCERVTRHSPDHSVWLSVDEDDDFTRELRRRLDRELGENVVRVLESDDDLLDLLWRQQERPALLIVLGHLETKTIVGEPEGDRIVLPGPAWLEPAGITQRTQDPDGGRWEEQPRALTLLMACGSAVIDARTVNSFVTALISAGASAVVGTEGIAFSGLAAEFAGEIAAQMWRPHSASVGQAVVDFRRRLAISRNPLGFMFSAYGWADVALAS